MKSIKKNSKGFWKLVRQKTKVNAGITDLVVDGKTVTSDIEKAEVLNNHFSSVFTIENLGNVPRAGLGFFRKNRISSKTPGKNWKKVVFSTLFRKKVEEIGIKQKVNKN